jgi:hypothetical protein
VRACGGEGGPVGCRAICDALGALTPDDAVTLLVDGAQTSAAPAYLRTIPRASIGSPPATPAATLRFSNEHNATLHARSHR